MFISRKRKKEIRNRLEALYYKVGRIFNIEENVENLQEKVKDLKIEQYDLDCKVDLLKLDSAVNSDLRTIFYDLASQELYELNSKLQESWTVGCEIEDIEYHNFYLLYHGEKVKKIYSDYSKVKFYEYGKEEIKNDILREAYTFYVSAKKLHENVEDIKNYINLIGSFDHMEAEAKEKDLLDKIQEI